MNTSDTSKITIAPFDLTRYMDVYDGSPEDWNAPVKGRLGLSSWEFTLAEIDRQDFSQLKTILGVDHFRTIVEVQGYADPQGVFETYLGEEGLALRYYFEPHHQDNMHVLVLVSFGEFQPGRWIAHVEGIWHVTGAPL